VIAGPFAGALERGRERFNARFALAQRLDRNLEAAAFAAHLRTRVAPLVDAVSAAQPKSVDAVTEALYDLSLELFSHDCLGPAPRFPSVGEVWDSLLPAAATLLSKDPRRVAAALSNASIHLARTPGARLSEWVRIMRGLASRTDDVDACLRAGQVAAWRCGMAHYREGALRAVADLPDALARAALDLPAGFSASKDRLLETLADRWRRPETAGEPYGPSGLAIVARAGGFRGFGGIFVAPPEVFTLHGTLYAFDSESCWSLHADLFGATLQRYGPDLPGGSVEKDGLFKLFPDGTVQKGGLSGSFPLLKGHRSLASDGTTLAVTLPRSHRIYLVAAV
jgi:hypothetical protein